MRTLLTSLLACICSTFFLGVTAGYALDIGAEAPAVSLTAQDGTTVSLADFKDKIIVLEWFNSGCPFVQKHYRNGDMQALQREFASRGVVWLMVNSTNAAHRDYLAPAAAQEFLTKQNVTDARMLLDPTGVTGLAYGAKTTPHLFIIDQKGRLAYQGAIDDDDSTDGDPKKARNFVREALNALLNGKPVATASTNPYGCSVKYAG